MKFNFARFKKIPCVKNDCIFFIVGVVFVGGVLYLFVNTISFLSTSVNTALHVDPNPKNAVRFNIADLPKLGIVVPSPTTTSR